MKNGAMMPGIATAGVIEYSLTSAEADALHEFLQRISKRQSDDSTEWANEAQVLADCTALLSQIPSTLLRTLLLFSKDKRQAAALIIRGLPLRIISKYTTPTSHGDSSYRITPDHILTILLASAIGDPIGYSTQQGGRIVNDIMPLKASANIGNSSNGFTVGFGHHTEDSFLTIPPAYFTLRCVRDPARLGVSISPIDVAKMEERHVVELFKPQFDIPPNPLQVAWTEAEHAKKSILFGSPKNPYVRFNHATTRSDTPEGADAIAHLLDHLDSQHRNVVIEPGDMIIVDNYLATHTRGPYEPRFDGDDRWLLRIVAYASLRQLRSSGNRQLGQGNVFSPPSLSSRI